MYIETKQHVTRFDEDDLSDFLSKLTIKINSFGLWESQKDGEARYSSDDFELIYYQKGGSQTSIGTNKYNCPEKSLLIIEPNSFNHSINKGKSSYSYYYIHFEIQPTYLQKELTSLLTRNGHVLYKEEFYDFSLMLERLLREAVEQDIGYCTVITAALIRILVNIIRAQKRRENKPFTIEKINDQHITIIEDTFKYIHEHIQTPIKLNMMAKTIGVSSSYLYKIFNQYLNMSPSQYILQYKITSAKKLLRQNNSVANVANMLGFSSAYHFSSVFKKHMNMSPKKYQINKR